MNNKETLKSYNNRLNTNNITLDNIIETIDTLPEAKEVVLQDKTIEITENGTQTIQADEGYDGLNEVEVITNVASSGGAKINVFMQETEPEIKKGIWLQSSNEYSDIVLDTNIKSSPTWYVNEEFGVLPRSFSNGLCAVVGDYLYLLCDKNSATGYKYNMIDKSWEQIANAPSTLDKSVVAVYDTDIYIFGGINGSALSTAYKYDTISDVYTTLASMPEAKAYACGDIVGTNIYIFGGVNNTGYVQTSQKVLIYDILTSTYSYTTQIPRNYTKNMSCISIGTNIYMFGGYYGNTSYKIAYKYDTITKTYTQLADLPLANSFQPIVLGNNIYLFESSTTTVLKYDVATNTYITQEDWTRLHTVWYAKVIMGNNKIYSLGTTSTTNGYEKTMEVLDPETSTYDNNSIIIEQDSNGDNNIEADLFNMLTTQPRLVHKFNDVHYYSSENGFNNTIPTYYGDGTQWIKFKN